LHSLSAELEPSLSSTYKHVERSEDV
jgi:hypothetical protein